MEDHEAGVTFFESLGLIVPFLEQHKRSNSVSILTITEACSETFLR